MLWELPVEAQQVIDGLLSSDDERDIINGNVPVESLRLHIELWIKAGKPHYSDKELGQVNNNKRGNYAKS